MYEYVDYMKCKHCSNTNCLFKIRVNTYQKKKTGNIAYKCTSECKICYLERCCIKNDKFYGKKENRDKVNAKVRAIRKGNPHYINIARKSYWKHREARLEQKRDKYKSIIKLKQIGTLNLFSRKRRLNFGPISKNHPYRMVFSNKKEKV